MISRRRFLQTTGAVGLGFGSAYILPGLSGPAWSRNLGPVIAPVSDGKDVTIALEAAERAAALPCFGGKTMPLWTFTEAGIPTVKLRLGDRLVANVKNRLPRKGEHISIHWHGIRLPNNEDGVSYVTQAPIMPGSEFTYSFTPPDTGTYFFHTHCNTVEHVGRGLAGVLIVTGDETVAPDHELVLVYKDWRIGTDGKFLPFITDEGAAKSGSPGNIRSVNGEIRPRYTVPASADIRIRFLDVDPSRIMEVGVQGAEAAVIAVDGIACAPFPLRSWRSGPATRLDLLVRSPKAGTPCQIVDYFAPKPLVLAELMPQGEPKRTAAFYPAPLRASRIAEPDLANAERLTFAFGATATGEAVAALAGENGIEMDALCLATRNFWAINKRSWPGGDHNKLGGPLAELKLGKSYIFELENLTPHAHPIHIHGHTFTFVSSNKRKFPPHKCDTIVLLPRERLEVALVADNPGSWMFHCHLLEHQETGMMGYVHVA